MTNRNRFTLSALVFAGCFALTGAAIAADSPEKQDQQGGAAIEEQAKSGQMPGQSYDTNIDTNAEQQAGQEAASASGKAAESKATQDSAAGTASSAAGTTASQGAADTAKSPKQVCQALLEATRKDDFAMVRQWTLFRSERMDGGRGKQQAGRAGESSASVPPERMRKFEREFHKLHQQNLSQLKSASCGAEQIAGDHAFVAVNSEGENRLLPMVRQEGRWMFDLRTYLSFYREATSSGAAG